MPPRIDLAEVRVQRLRGIPPAPPAIPRAKFTLTAALRQVATRLFNGGLARGGAAAGWGRVSAGRGQVWMAARWLLPVLAASAAVVGMPKRYAASVLVTVTADISRPGSAVEVLLPQDESRRQLLEAAWQTCAVPGRGSPHPWQLAPVADGSMCLTICDSRRDSAQALLSRVLEAWQQRLSSVAGVQSEQAAGEVRKLHERVSALDDSLRATEQHLRESMAGLGTDDPLAHLKGSWGELQYWRRRWDEVHERWSAAANERARLQAAPPPSAAPVESQDRQAAYAQDTTLQEDSRHLVVQLAEVRAALLAVWQEATPSLDELVENAGRLSQAGSWRAAGDAGTEQRGRVEQLAEAATEYRDLASGFARQWATTFRALQDAAPNGAGADIMESHDQLERILGDFRYALGGAASSLRLRVVALGELGDNLAAQHTLQSEVTRTHHQLSEAQKRFEAAVGALTSRENYRLDAALRSARGLAHRIRTRTAGINAQLEQTALVRAAEQRQAELSELTARVESLRIEGDGALEALLVAFDQCSRPLERLPQFVERTSDIEGLRGRMETLRQEQATAAEEFTRARAAAGAADAVPRIEVLDRMTPWTPENLGTLLVVAAGVWGLTFLLLMSGNWWPRRAKFP